MNFKELKIDFDDPKDLKKNITILQKRRKTILRQNFNYTEMTFNGSKVNLNTIVPLLDKIYDTPISHLYEEKDNRKCYYVYAHCNPNQKLNFQVDIRDFFLAIKFPKLTHRPFYVGKGDGNRWIDFSRNDSHRKIRTHIKKTGKEILPFKLIENLTEPEAFSYEAKLIDILGLSHISKNGFLVNLDEGFFSNERRTLYLDEEGKVKSLLRKNGFRL